MRHLKEGCLRSDKEVIALPIKPLPGQTTIRYTLRTINSPNYQVTALYCASTKELLKYKLLVYWKQFNNLSALPLCHLREKDGRKGTF